jgi:hypothetical protein
MVHVDAHILLRSTANKQCLGETGDTGACWLLYWSSTLLSWISALNKDAGAGGWVRSNSVERRTVNDQCRGSAYPAGESGGPPSIGRETPIPGFFFRCAQLTPALASSIHARHSIRSRSRSHGPIELTLACFTGAAAAAAAASRRPPTPPPPSQ